MIKIIFALFSDPYFYFGVLVGAIGIWILAYKKGWIKIG